MTDPLKREMELLYADWTEAIRLHDLDWMERHIAPEFTGTSHPFPNLDLDKAQFIAADAAVESVNLRQVGLTIQPFRDIVMVHWIVKINDLKYRPTKPADGHPGDEALVDATVGKTVAYCDAWRKNGQDWQCFMHHFIGAIDDSDAVMSEPRSGPELSESARSLYGQWIDTVNNRNYDWYDRHLPEDFTATAHPFRNFGKGRSEFLEGGEKLEYIEFADTEFAGFSTGDIFFSRMAGIIVAIRHGDDDLGPGRISARDLEDYSIGRPMVYSSTWRITPDGPKCFDHHIIVLPREGERPA